MRQYNTIGIGIIEWRKSNPVLLGIKYKVENSTFYGNNSNALPNFVSYFENLKFTSTIIYPDLIKLFISLSNQSSINQC